MLDRLRGSLRFRQDYVPEVIETASVGSHVVSGSLWSGLGLALTTVIHLVRSMIFARLLPPAAFGILSLANVFTQFILLFANFGFNSSIVYWRQLDRRDLATCWWGNLLVDSVAALLCVVFALAGTRWSDHPETRWVIMLLALQFLLVSFGSINAALMRRQFMFRDTAMVQVWGALAGFVGGLILIGGFNLGVYGLVGSTIIGTAVQTALYFVHLPWLPSWTFSWRTLREHMNYGRWFLGVNVVTYGNQNVDRALIGTRLDSTQLGYYEYASALPMQVTINLGTLLNSVLFPAFANLQQDYAELRRVLLRVMRFNAFIIYPFLVGLALTAPDFIRVAYGEKWMPIVWPTRVFCLFGMIRVMTNPAYSLCNGIGKPSLPFRWSLVALPFNAAAIWFGVGTGNVTMVAVAKIFLPLFMLLTLVVEVTRSVDMPIRMIGLTTLPAFLCCVAMAGVVAAVQQAAQWWHLPTLPSLLLQAAAGAAAYGGALRWLYPGDFAGLLKLARRWKPGS